MLSSDNVEILVNSELKVPRRLKNKHAVGNCQWCRPDCQKSKMRHSRNRLRLHRDFCKCMWWPVMTAKTLLLWQKPCFCDKKQCEQSLFGESWMSMLRSWTCHVTQNSTTEQHHDPCWETASKHVIHHNLWCLRIDRVPCIGHFIDERLFKCCQPTFLRMHCVVC